MTVGAGQTGQPKQPARPPQPGQRVQQGQPEQLPPGHNPAVAAIHRLAMLQQLTQAAISAGTERELYFIMLNQTASVLEFDRATLWDMRGKPALLGVSGAAKVNAASDAALAMRRTLAGLSDADKETILAGDDLPDNSERGTSMLWLPLPVEGRRTYGLLFERLASPAWAEPDVAAAVPLARIFSAALRVFVRSKPWRKRWTPAGRRVLTVAVLAAAAFLLAAVRLPLRIVAPCEVVVTRPLPVNAPLDGVIKDVAVRPGQDVAAGDVLVSYDSDVFMEELDVAQKQVEIARANLERAMALALADAGARAEARLLNNRLAQDEVRLEGAERRIGRLTITAPEPGTVIMGDPAEWVGRPVRTGESIMLLANQEDHRLRIWLPQDDRIEFDGAQDIKVFLNADAGRSRRARLDYVAAHAQAGPEGVYGFMAEADWVGGADGIKLGLRGTAVLYGEDVSLGYWLARKPLAAVRRFFGI